MIERVGVIHNGIMEINDFLGVTLYDLELYFGGDVADWPFTCEYSYAAGELPGNPFSGNPSVTYDSATNETKVYGRCNAPEFEEGGVLDFKFNDSEFGITLGY